MEMTSSFAFSQFLSLSKKKSEGAIVLEPDGSITRKKKNQSIMNSEFFEDWVSYYINFTNENPRDKKTCVDFFQSVTQKFWSKTDLYNNPNFGYFWFRLAKCVLDPEAVFAFMFCQQIGKKSIWFYQNLASFYESFGQYILAKESIRLGIESFPGHDELEKKDKLLEYKVAFEKKVLERLTRDFYSKKMTIEESDCISSEAFIELKTKSLVHRLTFVFESLDFEFKEGYQTPKRRIDLEEERNSLLEKQWGPELDLHEKYVIERNRDKRTLSELVNKTRNSSRSFGIYIDKHLREADDLLTYQYEFLCAKYGFKPKLQWKTKENAPLFWYTTAQLKKIQNKEQTEPPSLFFLKDFESQSKAEKMKTPKSKNQSIASFCSAKKSDSIKSFQSLAVAFRSPEPNKCRLESSHLQNAPQTSMLKNPETPLNHFLDRSQPISLSNSEYNPRQVRRPSLNWISPRAVTPIIQESFGLESGSELNERTLSNSLLRSAMVPYPRPEYSEPDAYECLVNMRKKPSKKIKVCLKLMPRQEAGGTNRLNEVNLSRDSMTGLENLSCNDLMSPPKEIQFVCDSEWKNQSDGQIIFQRECWNKKGKSFLGLFEKSGSKNE